jgi:hypothetical protein
MPYVCDNSRLTRTDQDELMPPKTSDFMYMPAEELGGPSRPAQLHIPIGCDPVDSGIESPDEARAIILALKALGIAKVYCRYDGGNDEGFAWVDHAEFESGERIDIPAIARRLIADGVVSVPEFLADHPAERAVQFVLDLSLAVNWAAALLGGYSFGTGGYWMYGALVADLVAETITDDPLADPIVQHIRIDGVRRVPGPLARGPE